MTVLKNAMLAAGLLIVSIPVGAHAVLLAATPAAGAAAHGPDISIRLRFNSRIDARRSRMMLLGPDGAQRVLNLGKEESPDVLVSASKGLIRGKWILRWQVLASDGHITRGEVPFQVE